MMYVGAVLAGYSQKISPLTSTPPRTADKHPHAKIAAGETDTLSLPFIDDFSYQSHIPDTSKWIHEGNTYRNNSFGVRPPTKGVLTFDAIQDNGEPYEFIERGDLTNFSHGLRDILISKPIDMSNVTEDSDAAMSFYWQMGTWIRQLHPELVERDSLLLLFMDSDSNWVRVWPSPEEVSLMNNTTPGDSFRYAHVPIDDPDFFHEGFRVKFENYGNQTAMSDIWNIDFVDIDTNKSPEAKRPEFAVTGRSNGLLTPYHDMPIKQFFANPTKYLSEQLTTQAVNLRETGDVFNDSTGTVRERLSSSTLTEGMAEVEKFSVSAGEYIDLDYSPDIDEIIDELELINALSPDSIGLSLRYGFKPPETDMIHQNNYLDKHHLLYDYFAYDDGSAEAAFVVDGFAEMAVMYELEKEQTIYSVDIYFPKESISMENTSIQIRLWSQLVGVDGAGSNELEMSTSAGVWFSDDTISTRNKFVNYQLPEPVTLPPGKFYVGYLQTTTEYDIPVGIDLEHDNADKMYARPGAIGEWNQNHLEDDNIIGSLMIRPVFSERTPVSTHEKEPESRTAVYPNPAKDYIIIKRSKGKNATIFDATGRVIKQIKIKQEEQQINVSELKKGMYFIFIETDDNTNNTIKLLLTN